MKMYKRIMIFGRPGSGKSTFARQLSQTIEVPVYHLDRYFYVENWIEREYDEFLSIQQSKVDRVDWIIDGNSVRSLETRYARADICLYFNYARLLCFWRILKRIIMNQKEVYDRPEGCEERFSWKLIKYMWNFEHRVNKTIWELRKKYPMVIFVEVKSDHRLREIECRLINGLHANG